MREMPTDEELEKMAENMFTFHYIVTEDKYVVIVFIRYGCSTLN